MYVSVYVCMYEYSRRVMMEKTDTARSSTRPKYRSEAAVPVSVSRPAGQDYDSSSSVSIHSGPSSPAPYHQTAGQLVPTQGKVRVNLIDLN